MKLPLACNMVGVQLTANLMDYDGHFDRLLGNFRRYLQYHEPQGRLSLEDFIELQRLILETFQGRKSYDRFYESFAKVGLDPDASVPLILHGDFGTELAIGLPKGELNLSPAEGIGECLVRREFLQVRLDVYPHMPGIDYHRLHIPIGPKAVA